MTQRKLQKADSYANNFIHSHPSAYSHYKPLLATKLSPPPLFIDMIPRLHLIKRLNEGMSCKLICLTTSAGYGKTILLMQWAKQAKWPVFWVTLGKNDTDPLHFWHYVVTSLEILLPDIRHSLQEKLYNMKKASSFEPFLTCLINELTMIEQEFTLVIDNYDVLNKQGIQNDIMYWLEHSPVNMHIVIASRSALIFPYARLHTQGQVLELHTADLRLSYEEIKLFFEQSLHIPIEEDVLPSLQTKLEGWAAGLRLLTMSSMQYNDTFSISTCFSYTNKYTYSYIHEEVFQALPQKIQMFLLYTSVLECMSGTLCDMLIEWNESQITLDWLVSNNLFIHFVGINQQWYQYHTLFREFLHAQLLLKQPELIPILHRRAAMWYEQHDMISQAINHSLNAHDFAKAARLIEQIGATKIGMNDTMLLKQWMDTLPNNFIQDHAQLCLFKACVLTINGRLHTAEQWLKKAKNKLNQDLKKTLSDANNLTESQKTQCDSMFHTLRCDIQILEEYVAGQRGEETSPLQSVSQLLDDIPTHNSFFHCIAMLNVGIAHRTKGALTTASKTFIDANAFSRINENFYCELTSLNSLAETYFTQGRLHLAANTYEQILQIAAGQDKRNFSPVISALLNMGELLYERNELESAGYYIDEVIHYGKRMNNYKFIVHGCVNLAQVRQAQGKVEESLNLIIDAEQWIQKYQLPASYTIKTSISKAQLLLTQGDTENAHACLMHVPANPTCLQLLRVTAQIFIIQGQLERALDIIEATSSCIDAADSPGILVECQLLKAVIYNEQGQQQKALKALEQALTWAKPEGFIRLFVDKGALLTNLLRKVALEQNRGYQDQSTPSLRSYIDILLTAMNELPCDTTKKLPSNDIFALAEPLRERELEIVRLIIAGLSTKEIAQQIAVAYSTVKWHVKNIYSKLSVHNRAQLIRRVDSLKL